jgi:hypothetical protein
MADYKNIKGFNIQYLDSDPPNPIEGQMWFNSTTQTLKGVEVGGIPAGTWASAAGITTARTFNGSSGVQTAAIYMGGPEPTYGGLTEIYNGTSWTEVGDLNTGRVYGFPSGFGTITATVVAGGENAGGSPANTESWNGSSWTEVGDLNVGKHGGAGFGTYTAVIAGAGYNPISGRLNTTESWNGTSWTELNDLNTLKYVNTGIGIQTAGLSVGGQAPGPTTLSQVESWDGTSWTETTDINTARFSIGGAGIQTSALIYGGNPGNYNLTEYWNGTSWTELNDLATGRGLASQQQGMSSTATLAVNPSTASEEWNVPDVLINTLTTS